MTPITTVLAARAAVAAGVTLATVILSTNDAHAVSLAVKLACASDYYAHCSQYAVGTPAVRQCMRAHGKELSSGCISALVDAGEVSKSEVERRVASAK